MISLLRSSRLRALLALAAVSVAASVACTGCIGVASCGASPVPDQQGAGARVDADGVVVYDKLPIGDSVTFAIPVKDTADVDETLIAASISGADADAFDVEATFPIDMPAGKSVQVSVTFHPNRSGAISAELLIETKDMGVSQAIELRGTGDDASGI